MAMPWSLRRTQKAVNTSLSLSGPPEPGAHADIAAEPRAKRAKTGNFDPAERVADAQMKYLAHAPPEVTDYIDKHFRHLLPDEERKQMHLDHPRPDCDAMQVPRVDEAMDRWLGRQAVA